MTHVRAYIDANILLECRDVRSLPWDDVANGSQVLVVVPIQVIREVDKHGYSDNERRRERSRDAKKLIRAVRIAPNGQLVILPSPQVTVCIRQAGGLKPIEDSADLQLITEILSDPDKGVARQILVTHDMALQILAESAGLDVFSVPDSWLRPAQERKLSKRVSDLERQLSELRQNKPDIELSLCCPEEPGVERIARVFSWYPPLSQERVEAFLAKRQGELTPFVETAEKGARLRLKTRTPRLVYVMAHSGEAYVTEGEIDRYIKGDLNQYIIAARRFLERAHDSETSLRNVVRLRLTIQNRGGAPASAFRIRIDASEGVLFARSPPAAMAPPGPPQLPLAQSDVQRMMSEIREFRLEALISDNPFADRVFETTQPWDPHELHCIEGNHDEPVSQMVFGCDDFMHGGTETIVNVVAIVDGTEHREKSYRIVAEAYCSNLPSRVSSELVVQADWKERNLIGLLDESDVSD